MIKISLQGGKELESSLRRYAKAVGMDAEEAVKELARTGARQLAMRTEPYGLTGKAKRIGEMAVSRDISLAYSSTARTYNELRRISPRKARAYGAAIEKGDHVAAERIVRGTLANFRDVEATDSGQHLESLRDSKGRVRSPQITNLTDPGAVSAIRKEKLLTAGTAKSGWVQCGENIGAKTRFPAWLRKATSLGTSSILKRGFDSIVTLFNKCRYTSNNLPESKARAALRATEANQLKRIEKVLEKRSREV
ncbi:hypothetical protein [Haloferula sp. BvORR071]|uniref:hypothetical protein n=1 Tax=Haloferula sp. BvORR071 TaxID=1396141 RepID=UPI00054FE001|nr:hypothetical protein [Haloferula sp. BvORR071]